MNKFFTRALYIKVTRNAFRVSSVSDSSAEQVFTPEQPFTTQRLLVGQFSVAQACLAAAFRAMSGKGLIRIAPVVVIHPQEMVEGGLSEVEERLFRELALGAGARKAVLWTGQELRSDQVMDLIKTAK